MKPFLGAGSSAERAAAVRHYKVVTGFRRSGVTPFRKTGQVASVDGVAFSVKSYELAAGQKKAR
jgi:hypothetical protein